MDRHRKEIDQEALRMICSISSGMIGICLTGISLIRVAISLRHRDTVADDLLAANAFLFLVTLFAAYFALRTISTRRLHRLEAFADAAFLVSMAFLTINCFFVTYAISGG